MGSQGIRRRACKRRFRRNITRALLLIALLTAAGLILVKLDYIMKVQADQMEQMMWIRQDVDELRMRLEVESDEQHEPEAVSLGQHRITYYCACEKCCGPWADGRTATGTIATEGRTIAVDPMRIPYGTQLMIDGQHYIAEDCGGSIKGNRIDISKQS